MKKIISAVIFILSFSFIHAQSGKPCKLVKGGMTQQQVIKLVGQPKSIELGGYGNGADTIIYWNYGNQQVIFSAGKVDAVKADLQKEDELAKKLAKGEIQPEQYFDLLEKVNTEGCK